MAQISLECSVQHCVASDTILQHCSHLLMLQHDSLYWALRPAISPVIIATATQLPVSHCCCSCRDLARMYCSARRAGASGLTSLGGDGPELVAERRVATLQLLQYLPHHLRAGRAIRHVDVQRLSSAAQSGRAHQDLGASHDEPQRKLNS